MGSLPTMRIKRGEDFATINVRDFVVGRDIPWEEEKRDAEVQAEGQGQEVTQEPVAKRRGRPRKGEQR